MDLPKIKMNRFLYLNKIYEEAKGSLNAAYDVYEIGEELGFDYDLTSNVVTYLTNEGLIEPYALGGSIRLTHYGIKEVEQAHENPEKPTAHFVPINYININSSGSGNIINTGNENVFSVSKTINQNKVVEKTKEIIQTLKNDSSIDENVRSEAILLLNQLISETETDKPSKSTMNKILTVGSNISSIGSLVISLFQLVCAV